MKAIYCPKCTDIVLLTYEDRSCRCGECRGRYVNNRDAETNGNGLAMGLGFGDFERGVSNIMSAPQSEDRKFYQDNCRLEYVWFRPNFGPGNPHTMPIKAKE